MFKISRDNVVKVEDLLIQLLYSSKNEEVLTESTKYKVILWRTFLTAICAKLTGPCGGLI